MLVQKTTCVFGGESVESQRSYAIFMGFLCFVMFCVGNQDQNGLPVSRELVERGKQDPT